MEREVVITGIGGQEIQRMATILAEAVAPQSSAGGERRGERLSLV